MRLYAMEAGFLSRLRSDRRELLKVARTLGTAAEMREARADLIASAHVLLAPKPGETKALYAVDADGVAHIPIVGELTPSAQTDACGAYTAEALTEYGYISAASLAADADPKVSAIAYDVNSPGGYVDGVDAVAQIIAAVSKPTIAYVDGMAASAAYWLASQADRIVALSPASTVGSIGVAAEEYDDSAALESEGIAHRVYTSTDAPDKRPNTATPEGRAKIIAHLDDVHSVFVRRVSDGRNVSAKKVNEDFGRGGVVIAEKALAAGMIDEVRGSHLSRIPAGVASSAAATTAATSKSKESEKMDITQLKAEHPDLVAQISAEAEKNGIDKERQRREKLLTLAVNGEARKSVEASIAAGESFEEASPKAVTAALRGTGGENAPDVATQEAERVSGPDPEFLKTAALAGITQADLEKYGPKEKE